MNQIQLLSLSILCLETVFCKDLRIIDKRSAESTTNNDGDEVYGSLSQPDEHWGRNINKRTSAYKRLPGWSVYYGKRSGVSPLQPDTSDTNEKPSSETQTAAELREIPTSDINVNDINTKLSSELSGFGKLSTFHLGNGKGDTDEAGTSYYNQFHNLIAPSFGNDNGEIGNEEDTADSDLISNLDEDSENDANNELFSSEKRMQGWGITYGKRPMAWQAIYGKRSPTSLAYDRLRKAWPALDGKRAPGWAATYGKRAPGWAATYGKRAPGWAATYGKRAPGWAATYGKRAPGWAAIYGKRAPGWAATYGKRAPGWAATYGKRAPGWAAIYGKRAPGWAATYGKRAPGWEGRYGKRAPGWAATYGKRAPGWAATYGKRSDEINNLSDAQYTNALNTENTLDDSRTAESEYEKRARSQAWAAIYG